MKFETAENKKIFIKNLNKIKSNPCLVLDIGSGKTRGKNLIKGYKIEKYIKNKIKLINIDIVKKVKPKTVADAACLPFKTSCFDIVFLESILEHIWPISNLEVIAKETYRVLKKDGIVLGWVPFFYPWHGLSDMPDVIRFTPQILDFLFKNFSQKIFELSGGPLSIFLRSTRPLTPYWLKKFQDNFRKQIQKLESKILVKSKNHPCLGIRFILVK